ncbi:MAG: Uma2 family endonuclease [Plectolyngbya sp. WJT66-NPBG17]|jgi:Uma2 family endonuclease|nr:Uma2 family endonuclease [Plectolyngbya sp. WJT66-NPBG17]MBW4524527.1 Uma2 family endonuclease [Phormidium tanganyikae FI6-MK23]
MTQAKSRFKTIDEYLNYDDGTNARYELVNGALIELPNEDPHNLIIARFLLIYFVTQMGISLERVGDKQQIAVNSSEVTAREPDLTVHSEASVTALLTQTQSLLAINMPPPLLVIEVVSPGNPGSGNYDRDYVEKAKEYAARGIPEYWLVDPGRRIVIVLTLENQTYKGQEFRGNDAIASPTFPSLRLTAEQILAAGQ